MCLFLQRCGGFSPTSPFKASSLECDRYFWASSRHQVTDLHAVIELRRGDVETTHNLMYNNKDVFY